MNSIRAAAVVVAAGVTLVWSLAGQEARKPTVDAVPPPVSAEQQAAALRLNRDAYRAAVKVADAIRRQAEAKLDQEHAQQELDNLNQQITQQMKEIRALCRADEKSWDIDDHFNWIPRSKK